MKSIWNLGLSVLLISIAMGCAHRMVTEDAAVAPQALEKPEQRDMGDSPYSGSTPPGDGELYEVTVKQVVMGYTSAENVFPVIVLVNKENDRQILPISVGMSEGRSINMALKKLEFARPGTHDLFASVLGQFRMKLVKVVIIDLRKNTYIATMTMEFNDETKEIDARPSDAIALALRCVAPIFVSEEVIRKGGWMKVPEQHEKQSEAKKEGRLL